LRTAQEVHKYIDKPPDRGQLKKSHQTVLGCTHRVANLDQQLHFLDSTPFCPQDVPHTYQHSRPCSESSTWGSPQTLLLNPTYLHAPRHITALAKHFKTQAGYPAGTSDHRGSTPEKAHDVFSRNLAEPGYAGRAGSTDNAEAPLHPVRRWRTLHLCKLAQHVASRPTGTTYSCCHTLPLA
jgi:hypothetical protein